MEPNLFFFRHKNVSGRKNLKQQRKQDIVTKEPQANLRKNPAVRPAAKLEKK